MILAIPDRIKRGNFADIFVPPPGDRAFKLFRRITDRHLANKEQFIFEAEVRAYELLAKHPHLKRFAPEFFGGVAIDRVNDARGRNVARFYCTELCYSMERLPDDQDERKFASFFGTPEWSLVEPIRDAFEGAGISSLGDSSVLHWRSGEPRLIDFAVYDAAGRHWRWA
jgi:hypothetical protein